MEKKLKNKILQGKYNEAALLCENLDSVNLSTIILRIVYDTENLSVYTFVQYMINSTKEIKWIELAIEIMIHPLCHVEGAYSVALFHAREMLAIDRNVRNLERILFFYNIPEKLVDVDEAESIAEEILSLEDDNEIAFEVIFNKQLNDLVDIHRNCSSNGVEIICFKLIKDIYDGMVLKENVSKDELVLAQNQLDETFELFQLMGVTIEYKEELMKIISLN